MGMRRDWIMNEVELRKRQGNRIDKNDEHRLPKRHRRRGHKLSVNSLLQSFNSSLNDSEASSSSAGSQSHSPESQDQSEFQRVLRDSCDSRASYLQWLDLCDKVKESLVQEESQFHRPWEDKKAQNLLSFSQIEQIRNEQFLAIKTLSE